MSIATEAIRRRAIEAYKAKEGTQTQIASMYRITLRTFQRWWRRYLETKIYAPGKRGARPSAVGDKAMARLDKILTHKPDSTLEELKQKLGVNCSIMAIHRATIRLDWRYKKSRYERVSKIAPT